MAGSTAPVNHAAVILWLGAVFVVANRRQQRSDATDNRSQCLELGCKDWVLLGRLVWAAFGVVVFLSARAERKDLRRIGCVGRAQGVGEEVQDHSG